VLQREIDGNGLPGYRRTPKSDAQAAPTYRYFPGTGGNITYSKTALWLNTMERWMSWPVLQRIMATHFAKSQFAHPKPQQFFDTVNEVAGRDLTGFFDQVYRSSNAFDYGVQELKSTGDDHQYHTTVVARRYGEAVFPVDVVVTFRNGERVTEHWDGADRWKLYAYDRESQALSVQVDPNRVLLLDVNYTNNSTTLEPNGDRAATRWSLTWATWLEDCLLSWAALV
jgi:aminopeptidase N